MTTALRKHQVFPGERYGRLFSRVDIMALEFPYTEHDSRAGVGDRRRQQVMSKHQRAATVEPMARWLVAAARMAATSAQMVVAEVMAP